MYRLFLNSKFEFVHVFVILIVGSPFAAFAGYRTPQLFEDHRVEMKFKPHQKNPIEVLRAKLVQAGESFRFPFSELFPNALVLGRTCFVEHDGRVFVQAYGDNLNFLFHTESWRNERRDETYKKTKELVEKYFESEKEDEVLKVLKITSPEELKVLETCKKILQIEWPDWEVKL